MGNVCGTSGSHHVYSPPVSPRHVSGSSTPVHNVAGQALTSVYQLSDEAREDFLSRHDPMQKLGLHSETAFIEQRIKHTCVEGSWLAIRSHAHVSDCMKSLLQTPMPSTTEYLREIREPTGHEKCEHPT